jgi:hypothetical protein
MMTPEDVEAAVGRAIDTKLGQFYIDRETHYQDHEFIQAMRKWTEEAKGTVLRSVIKTLSYAALGFLILGFIVWGRTHFEK